MLARETGMDRFEQVISTLGRPYARGTNYAIYNADCLIALQKIQECSVDLFITSPPYNIGKSYERDLDHDIYDQWCEDWIRLIHKSTRASGAFWLNLGYNSLHGRAKAMPIIYRLWNRIPFFLMQEIVWNYGAGVSARKFLSPRNEKFLWYVKDENSYTFNLDAIRDPDVKYPNQKKNGKLRCNSIGKNPSDVWQIAKVTSGAGRASAERTSHPAQFPAALIDRIVKGFSNEGDLIIDPFMGSGTTLASSISNGRYAIGIEIDSGYCAIARDRLSKDLFSQSV